MNTKEAIEFLEYHKITSADTSYTTESERKKENKEIDKVIDLLQQGEKYRLTLKALNRNYGHYLIGVKDNGEVGAGYTIRDFINMSKQKYFPKKPSQDYKEGEE